jgi:type VI secretion system secreted protein Hcp
MGGGSGKGKAEPGLLSWHTTTTRARPCWPSAAPTANTSRTVVLTARKAGEGQKDFLKVT